jgi:hypothetical protein
VNWEDQGALDAQRREIKKISGCVTALGFIVLLLGITFSAIVWMLHSH